MSVNDNDLELLETWLDGELPQEQVDALRRRLSSEPALAQTADALRSDRQMRAGLFQSMEGLDSEIETLITSVRRATRKDELWRRRFTALRQVSGIAAAIVLMFGAGWISHSRLQVGDTPEPVTVSTSQQPAPSQQPANPPAGSGMMAMNGGNNDFRINRPIDGGGNTQFVSRNQPNPLLMPFDKRVLSVTRPMFQVQVLDAFGNVQFVKPMDSFNDAIQFADYIGRYQGQPSQQPATGGRNGIVPVNTPDSP